MPSLKSTPCSCSTPGHEAGIAGDVREQQVALAGRRLGRGQLRSYRVCSNALPVLVLVPMSVDVLQRRHHEIVGQLHARLVVRAIAVGVLRQVLLVVVLGVDRGRRLGDLGRDRRRSPPSSARAGRCRATPWPSRAARRRACRSRTGTGVPTSLPWRMPWVGSWSSQKRCSSSSYVTTRRVEDDQHASAWPVRPVHTSS